jgi:hypothetical protein
MKLRMLIIIILLIPAVYAYRDPYITLPEQVEGVAGETAHFEVIFTHVQTSMWNVQVYVDTTQIKSNVLERLEISVNEENPAVFDDDIPMGEEIAVPIDIAISSNSPSGEVSLPIIVKGAKGPCQKGCEPFFVQKSTTLFIRRKDPKLAVLLPQATLDVVAGEKAAVEIQIKNYGTASAYVNSLEAVSETPFSFQMQTVPKNVGPGSTIPILLTISTGDVSPGSYLVQIKLEYRDKIQNTFNDSKTLYLTIVEETPHNQPTAPPTTVNPQSPSPTPQPSSDADSLKYQYFLVGMVSGGALFGVAVMVGIFLKKRRPTQ